MVFLSVSLKDFFCIHLPATRAGIAPESILTVAGINESKSSLYVILYPVLIHTRYNNDTLEKLRASD